LRVEDSDLGAKNAIPRSVLDDILSLVVFPIVCAVLGGRRDPSHNLGKLEVGFSGGWLVHKTVADFRLEAVAVSTRPGHEPNVRFHNVLPRKPTGSKPEEFRAPKAYESLDHAVRRMPEPILPHADAADRLLALRTRGRLDGLIARHGADAPVRVIAPGLTVDCQRRRADGAVRRSVSRAANVVSGPPSAQRGNAGGARNASFQQHCSAPALGRVCDPHETANVVGANGLIYFLQSVLDTLVDLRVQLSWRVRATGLETSGARLTASHLAVHGR
jgi:hypothetical protein